MSQSQLIEFKNVKVCLNAIGRLLVINNHENGAIVETDINLVAYVPASQYNLAVNGDVVAIKIVPCKLDQELINMILGLNSCHKILGIASVDKILKRKNIMSSEQQK